ncbi:ATP synthase d subunit [Maublancomyces gigas]|uniref:ATP synthase subunit d, mitochondrial n=1 Tax=Discina gigas TaxID=1032678 RepID=A0ABR3GY55_9PEZI
MSAPVRSAALKIEWVKITASLGLKGQTAASLLAFKKRNEDARRKVNLLQAQPQNIDFAHYRATLKNQAVVEDIERSFKSFRPVTVDVPKQLKAIEAFEAQAVLNAQATKGKVDAELADLEKTLKNIEEARPFEDLTVDDIAKARPDIDIRTEQMVSKGRWMVPGYKEKFGDLGLM